VSGAAVGDLDPLLVNRFTETGQGDAPIQLQRLHLVTETDDGPLPTVAGVLLCTVAPQRWLRNAEIIAVHFVRRNMRTPARKPLGRVDYPQYDLAAVFEAVVSAVAHRDYSRGAQGIRLFLFAAPPPSAKEHRA
jgi:ATP-dependent DNA helicase RecG